jgi:hypothetical protein
MQIKPDFEYTFFPCNLYRVGNSKKPYTNNCPIKCKICSSKKRDVFLDINNLVPAQPVNNKWNGMSWSDSDKDFERFIGYLWVVKEKTKISSDFVIVNDRLSRNGLHFSFTCKKDSSLDDFRNAVDNLNALSLYRLNGASEPLEIDDERPPSDKDSCTLAYALDSYARSLKVNSDIEVENYNNIIYHSLNLIRGCTTTLEFSENFNLKEIWEKVYQSRTLELLNLLESESTNEDLQADVAMDRFDLDLLQKYLEDVIYKYFFFKYFILESYS